MRLFLVGHPFAACRWRLLMVGRRTDAKPSLCLCLHFIVCMCGVTTKVNVSIGADVECCLVLTHKSIKFLSISLILLLSPLILTVAMFDG